MKLPNKTVLDLQTILLLTAQELNSFEETVTQVKKIGAPVVIDLERLDRLIQQLDTFQNKFNEILALSTQKTS